MAKNDSCYLDLLIYCNDGLWALICNSVHGSDYPTDLSVLTYGDIAHGLKGLETSASTFLSRNDRFDARYTFS
jgi:hypothetical protein